MQKVILKVYIEFQQNRTDRILPGVTNRNGCDKETHIKTLRLRKKSPLQPLYATTISPKLFLDGGQSKLRRLRVKFYN